MSEVFFNGPAGRIEGQYAESTNPDAPVALVLHPHPLYGGTMNNKVIFNLYKTLFKNGFTVLRINFRGVGKSMGEFDQGVGEMTDAATALDWLQARHHLSKVNLIAGFSFGSWISMQLIMRRPEITHFISVAPPVNKYDFSFLSPCPISGLIVQGDIDSVVAEYTVSNMVHRISKQRNIEIDYRVVHGADHFFRNKMDAFNNEVDDYLKNTFDAHSSEIVKTKNLKSSSPPVKKMFLD